MKSAFKSLSQGDKVLLISCPAGAGYPGALLTFNYSDVEVIDSLSTTGLCFAENRIYRLLWADNEADVAGELLGYDERGIVQYSRIDELAEAHDIAWNGSEFIVVSTATNSVLSVSPAGKVTSRWKRPEPVMPGISTAFCSKTAARSLARSEGSPSIAAGAGTRTAARASSLIWRQGKISSPA